MDHTLVRDLFGDDMLRSGPDLAAVQGTLMPRFLAAYEEATRDVVPEELGRLAGFFASFVRGDSATASPDSRQRPLSAYCPGLSVKPWYDADAYPVTRTIARTLEGGFSIVLGELRAQLSRSAGFMVRNPTSDRYVSLHDDEWSVCNLVESGRYDAANTALFPETTRLVRSIDTYLVPGG